jgi:hypothetical protein
MRILAGVLLNLCLAPCTGIGPSTVAHDRIDYATAIGNSWKEQTLLKIESELRRLLPKETTRLT